MLHSFTVNSPVEYLADTSDSSVLKLWITVV